MKKIILAATLIAICGSANAAFAQTAPLFNWSGFYTGVNAGYGWGKTTATDAGDDNSIPFYAPLGAQFSNHSSGFTGGAQAGYNWQAGVWVFGGEVDFGYLGLKGTGGDPNSLPVDLFVKTNGSYDATFRARFGYAADNVLVYLTGGAILADFGSYIHYTFHPLSSDSAGSQWGWVVGTGVEYAFAPAWSVKFEYLYYETGSKTVILLNGGNNNKFPIENTGNLLRVGLNYQFGAR